MEKLEAKRANPRFSYPSSKKDNPPTVVLGHSNDVCIDDTLEELIVQPNCVYVTFTECGLVSYVKDIKIKKFFDPENRKYLEDPIKYEDKLTKIFDDIHIHKPGDTYVNTQYLPNSSFPLNHRYGMSGVIPIDGDSKFINSFIYNSTTPKERIENSYEYSIYPLKKAVSEELENQEKLQPSKEKLYDTFSNSIIPISQKILFLLRPGVYYNPLCRVIKKGCSTNVGRRRRHSLNVRKIKITEVDIHEYKKYYIGYIEKIAHNCKKGKCEDLDELDRKLPTISPIGLYVLNTIFSDSKYKDDEYISKLKTHIGKIKNSNVFKLTIDIYKLISSNKSEEILQIIKDATKEEKSNLKHLINIQIDRNLFNLKEMLEDVNTDSFRQSVIHPDESTLEYYQYESNHIDELRNNIYKSINNLTSYEDIDFNDRYDMPVKYYTRVDLFYGIVGGETKKDRTTLLKDSIIRIEENISNLENLRERLKVVEGGKRKSMRVARRLTRKLKRK